MQAFSPCVLSTCCGPGPGIAEEEDCGPHLGHMVAAEQMAEALLVESSNKGKWDGEASEQGDAWKPREESFKDSG